MKPVTGKKLPYIITASRATDIPAFYGRWIVDRFEKGSVSRINPFNGKSYEIMLDGVKCIVFWTKNPQPFLEYIPYFEKKVSGFYFHYTLNDYPVQLEPHLPELETRIESFINLSRRIGKKKVIWRFDPMLLSDGVTPRELIEKVFRIYDKIHDYTEKLVFSFADIDVYRKVKLSMNKHAIAYRSWNDDDVRYAAEKLGSLVHDGFTVASCAENHDLSEYKIAHNACVDPDLINSIVDDDGLRSFLAKKNNFKDPGQRKDCRCARSSDIGQYSTCPHLCRYCYANGSEETVVKNYRSILSPFPDARLPHAEFNWK